MHAIHQHRNSNNVCWYCAVTIKATGPVGVTPKPPGAVTQPASKAGASSEVDNSVSAPALKAAAKIIPDSTPAVKPAAKPPVKQASKPAVETAAKPAGEAVAKPAAKPAVKPAAKPAVKPAVKEVNDEQEGDGVVAVKKKGRERAAGPALQSAYMVSCDHTYRIGGWCLFKALHVSCLAYVRIRLHTLV